MPSHGLLLQHESDIDILRRIIDGLIIVGSLVLASWLYNTPWTDKYSIAAILGLILFYLLSKINYVYTASRYRSMTQEIKPIIITWVGVISGLLIFAYMAKVTADYSRVTLGLWFVITPSLLILFRFALRAWLKIMRIRGYNTRSTIIVGTGKCAQRLAENIRSVPWTGLKLLGFITEKTHEPDGQILGGLDELYRKVETNQVEVVYIALPMNHHKLISDILEKLADSTVSVFLAPDFDVYGIMQGRWAIIGDTPTVSIVDTPMLGINSVVKRIEDLTISGLGILMTAPLMVLIAIAIKLDSKGPVFYIQNRHGFNGKIFPMYKFRTMNVMEKDTEFRQSIKNDDRVTRVGRLLRKTSIDELPQLFNVLIGQMSMVGPRPHALAHNEQFRGTIFGFMLRHKIKPGMTGLAQIKGFRGETDTDDKMEKRYHYDMEYLNNWSVWLDLKIIISTPIALITDKNVY